MSKSATPEGEDARASEAALDAIMNALAELRYGQLQLQDSRVVKIMRTENVRLYDECASRAHDDGAR